MIHQCAWLWVKPRGNRLDYFTAVLVIAMVAKNEEEFVRYMAMSEMSLKK